jgi:polysaccharide deacetylase family protein (PEP-CTERM system associated)
MNSIVNLNKKYSFTIDWEDFGQLYYKYYFDKVIEPSKNSIERQTYLILELLDCYKVKGTFFVLGMLAKYRPNLVRKIAQCGHEIALHGMHHEYMYQLNRNQAFADLNDSKKIVSDIIGSEIYGYRAPFFSLKKENLYLLDDLAKLDFEYDSSIFPLGNFASSFMGFSNEDKLYCLPSGLEIVELPLTTIDFSGKKIPISGGGYIRLLPKFIIKKIFNTRKNLGAIVYMHPYEFDPVKIRVDELFSDIQKNNLKLKNSILNFRWNLFRPSVVNKIEFILNSHQFETCKERSDKVKNETLCSTVLG